MCKDCGCSITQDRVGHLHSHGDQSQTTQLSSAQVHHEQVHHTQVHSNPQLNDKKTLAVIHKILDKNDVEAQHNREHFKSHHVSAFNIMSSPGSGKTTLLECLPEYLDCRFSVIEGDLETSRDADRLIAKGIDAYQIQTGSACHLDAFMVHGALHHIDLTAIDICFVENVGNLVCPASYDVGAHRNIVLLSVPEGDDKIEKYPVMFRRADVVLITKSDLLPHFNFSLDHAKAQLHKLNPNAEMLVLSVKDSDSMKTFAKWIVEHQES